MTPDALKTKDWLEHFGKVDAHVQKVRACSVRLRNAWKIHSLFEKYKVLAWLGGSGLDAKRAN